LRGELDWVVLKCLEKQRDRRYDTANGLARDIQRYLADEVVEARPPSVGYRVSKFIRRHKGQVIAASLVLFALLAGIAGTTWGLIRADERRVDAERAQAAEADRVTERDQALEREGERGKERDEALKQEAARGKERDAANDELKHRLGVSAMVLASAAFESRDYKLTAERLDKVPAEQRGWEWRYLKRQLNGGIFTLYGHTSAVTSVAFSPDGTRIVTGGGDQNAPFEAKVWDARTGRYLFDLKGLPPSLQGINTPLVCVAFSADSKRIVTAGGGDKTARVYDATTGTLQLELKDPAAGDGVQAAAFSPDGTWIVTAYRGRVKLSDARTGKVLLEWRAGDATRVAVSPDGTRILTGGLDQTVRVWDARTAKLLLEAKGMMGYDSDIAFSPDGKRIVAGRGVGTTRVIDAQTGVVLLELKIRPMVVNTFYVTMGVLCVAFSPDGTRIVTGGTTGVGEASVWDARTGAELLELKGHTGDVMSVAFSPDGERIITGSADGTAKVWDARTGTPRYQLEGFKGPVASAALSPDGTWIVTGGGQLMGVRQSIGEATVWDARTGMPRFALKGFKGRVNSVAISPDGMQIATGGGESLPVAQAGGEATVWDARTGQALFELKGLKDIVASLAFSSDGARIITGEDNKTSHNRGNGVKVWDAQTGTLLLDLTQPAQGGFRAGARVSVAFSPDGKRVVVAGARSMTSLGEGVTVRDAQTGAALLELKAPNDTPLSVAFSPDGARIAVGHFNKTATVWDAEKGTPLLDLKGHTGNVYSVAFSPDGARIVTGSGDRTARVWDARTGVTLAELKGYTGAVTSVSFSADGTRILSAGGLGGKMGEVVVWDAPIPKPALELAGHTSWIHDAAFSPDGARIVTGSDDKTVKVWDTQTAAMLLDLTGHTAGVHHVAFSVDGTRILSSDLTTVKIWDAKTGSALLELKGKPGETTMAAFSPDGSRIVTGGSRTDGKHIPKGVATVWDATTGKPLVELSGDTFIIESVAFSTDGTRFFTVARDGITKAWDAGTGKEVPGAAIPPITRNERTSPDGHLFARLYQDRVQLISLVPAEEEIAYRRLHTQPNLSRYRASYLAARAAKDDFAAAFYLNLIPPDERKAVLAQAEADAFAALTRLADEHQGAGKLEEALPLRIEILTVNKAKLGPEDPATIQAAETLGRVYNQMGQYEKAIPLLEDVLKYRKAKQDPQTPNAMWMLGLTYKDAGRLKEAIALFEEAATKNAWMIRDLLDAYALAGEPAKIVALCEKQLAEGRKANPDTDPNIDLLTRLGRAYSAQKKWSEAEPHLRECMAITAKWADATWMTFDAQSLLGGSLLGQRKYAEAEPLLLKGYEGLKQWEKSLEPRDAPRLREAVERLVQLYEETDKKDEASKWRKELEAIKSANKNAEK
jgi:WD40 repeat protein/tetratricopeptide (TPR) repeat protein